jgi:hypothetical protein
MIYVICDLTSRGTECSTGVVHLGNVAAVQNHSRTNLITVALILGLIWVLSLTLTSSMRKEILGPMERIVKILEALIHNPLGSMDEQKRKIAETEKLNAELKAGMVKDQPRDKEIKEKVLGALAPRSRKGARGSVIGSLLATLPNTKKRQSLVENVYEVEKAIVRVGNLLQLGLGEAGVEIISGNIKDGKMVFDRGGKLLRAIFGFCDIRNFTDCTEVLQADIVKLVNGVARHIHTCTIENFGAPNKNIGDAFLLVWQPKGDICISTVADASLRSYVRAIIQMQMCKELRRWEVSLYLFY